jgi:hypothetical protein
MPRIDRTSWDRGPLLIDRRLDPRVALSDGLPFNKQEIDSVRLLAHGQPILAVHLGYSPDDRDLWVVTHFNSGLRILRLRDMNDAVKFAEFLAEEMGPVLAQEMQEEVVKNIPEWMRVWVRAMWAARAWIDPTGYRS